MDEKVQILGGVIIAYADSFLDDEPLMRRTVAAFFRDILDLM